MTAVARERRMEESESDKEGEPLHPWEIWVWKLLKLDGSSAGMVDEQTSVRKCAMGDAAKVVSAYTAAALPGPIDISCQEPLNNAVLKQLCSWLFTERWVRVGLFSAPFLTGHIHFPKCTNSSCVRPLEAQTREDAAYDQNLQWKQIRSLGQILQNSVW